MRRNPFTFEEALTIRGPSPFARSREDLGGTLWTLSEVAELKGVSQSQILADVRSGFVSYVDIGGILFFPEDEIEEYIEGRTADPEEEPQLRPALPIDEFVETEAEIDFDKFPEWYRKLAAIYVKGTSPKEYEKSVGKSALSIRKALKKMKIYEKAKRGRKKGKIAHPAWWRELKRVYEEGIPFSVYAEDFDVTETAIRNALIAMKLHSPKELGPVSPSGDPLWWDELEDIYVEGIPPRVYAEKFGVSKGAVRDALIKRKKYIPAQRGRKKRDRPAWWNELEKVYEKGTSLDVYAEMFNRTRSAVKDALISMGKYEPSKRWQAPPRSRGKPSWWRDLEDMYEHGTSAKHYAKRLKKTKKAVINALYEMGIYKKWWVDLERIYVPGSDLIPYAKKFKKHNQTIKATLQKLGIYKRPAKDHLKKNPSDLVATGLLALGVTGLAWWFWDKSRVSR